MRQLIELDLQRGCQVNPSSQSLLVNLLYIHSKENMNVNYKQGQHEIATLCWNLIQSDSIRCTPTPDLPLDTATAQSTTQQESESVLSCLVSSDYVEHDTYSLYSAIMRHIAPYYDTTPTLISPPSSLAALLSPLPLPPPILQSPIITIAHHIHHSLLRSIDPALYSTLSTLEIDPQLYLLKWLRLLFAREFSLPQSIHLWTGIFRDRKERETASVNPHEGLGLVNYIVLAMLLRIREAILDDPEYSNVLGLLLRYPQYDDDDVEESRAQDHDRAKIGLLLQQANTLRAHTTEAASEQCRKENRIAGVEWGEESEVRRQRRVVVEHGTASENKNGTIAARAPASAGSMAAALLFEGVGELARRAEGTFNELRVSLSSSSPLKIPAPDLGYPFSG